MSGLSSLSSLGGFFHLVGLGGGLQAQLHDQGLLQTVFGGSLAAAEHGLGTQLTPNNAVANTRQISGMGSPNEHLTKTGQITVARPRQLNAHVAMTT